MNFVFWILVIIVMIAVWVGLCMIFKPLGRFFLRIFTDIKEHYGEDKYLDEIGDRIWERL